jgi:lipoate-protein ligase B
LKYFDLINPCGLEGKKMTSIGKILGTGISREQLVERIEFHFKQIFQRDWEEKKLEEIIKSLVSPQPTLSPQGRGKG